MGVVYLAEQHSLGRMVALKGACPRIDDIATHGGAFSAREAQAAAGLHHTNIVPVFGTGEDQGRHFLRDAVHRGAESRSCARNPQPEWNGRGYGNTHQQWQDNRGIGIAICTLLSRAGWLSISSTAKSNRHRFLCERASQMPRIQAMILWAYPPTSTLIRRLSHPFRATRRMGVHSGGATGATWLRSACRRRRPSITPIGKGRFIATSNRET